MEHLLQYVKYQNKKCIKKIQKEKSAILENKDDIKIKNCDVTAWQYYQINKMKDQIWSETCWPIGKRVSV